MELPKQEDSENKTSSNWIFLFRQILSCSPVVLNFLIQGLYIGSSTVIVAQLRKEANSTDAVTPEVSSWLSSTSSYCGIPWTFVLPILAYRYGRKIVLMLVSLSILVGNIVYYFSTNMTELIISQAMQGILLASSNTVSIMVMSEYTSPRYRGVIMSCKSATFFWGVWIANAIGTFFYWRNIGIVIFVCCALYISIFFSKESPYWLAMKGRFDDCARVHRWLKGTDRKSEEELERLIFTQKEYLHKKLNTEENKITIKTFFIRNKSFYKSVAYTSMPICLYMFSGKIAYTVYAIDLIKDITSSEQLAYKGMLILDAVTVISMYLGCVIAKYVTRRKQLLIFASIAAVFLYVLSFYIYFNSLNLISENHFVSIFLLTGFSISIGCGPMILTNCYTSELTPLRDRSIFVCWISLFTITLFATAIKIGPFIFKVFSIHGAFLFYAIMVTIIITLSYFYLPETKDKTILEVHDYLSGERTKAVNTELLRLTK